MHVRVTPLLLAATVLSTVLAGTPLARPAAADTGPLPLGLTSLSRVVLDEAQGQLFLSPGRSGSGVRVTDLAGGNARTIDGLPGRPG